MGNRFCTSMGRSFPALACTGILFVDLLLETCYLLQLSFAEPVSRSALTSGPLSSVLAACIVLGTRLQASHAAGLYIGGLS